jgi:hypothetical protein
MSQRWVLLEGELAAFMLGGVSFLMTAAAWLSGSPWDSAFIELPLVCTTLVVVTCKKIRKLFLHSLKG